MAGRRDLIKMTDEERHAFLDEQRIVQVTTLGPNGRPHLMPLWYVPDGDDLIGWTYAKSQKTKNLERDPRATIGIDTGVEYQELRGVMMECDVEIERDPDEVVKYGIALIRRYAPGVEGAEDAFRAQAVKRVGLRFRPTRTVTWDHRKLGGGY
jgi:PPOX class probable F420-dependent enzyme